jgi:glycosyltransferase involved in cell wall biosynthesis
MPEFKGKVLLLGNYVPDQQESMQRFAQILLGEFPKRGIQTELIRPEPLFGRFSKNKWFGYADKLIFFPSRLKRRLRTLSQKDVLHICDHSNAVYTRHAPQQPNLVTCHDLLAIRSALGEIPENPTSSTGRKYQRMILEGLNRARRVACVSHATMNDLRRLSQVLPTQMTVIENGLNYPFKPMEHSEAMARLAKLLEAEGAMWSGRFILHVGGNQWYKNRNGAVEIYQQLLQQYPKRATPPDFFLVGKPWPSQLREKVEMAGLDDAIVELNDVENEDLRALYSTADALLFPSLMEGFGWPIIEAQACGCPVVTSNVAPMSEIGGEAAVYIDPRSWTSAAKSLFALLSESDSQKAERRAKGLANAARFSVGRMIERYIEEYNYLTTRR